VQGGKFVPLEFLPTGPIQPGKSDDVVTPRASLEAQFRAVTGPPYQPPSPKRGQWALLVATSSGWDNYRHQADVFGQYQMLRASGVPADHIIVVTQDDVASDRRNPRPGQVVDEVGGGDLRGGVPIDYHLRDVDAGAILSILAGRRSATLPKVVDSTAGDNVYVFIAGHGDENGVYVGLDRDTAQQGDRYTVLKPADLGSTVSSMSAAGRYRRMLIAVEACKGGAMGTSLTAPGALLVSGARPTEDSISANFDRGAGVWLTDEFANRLLGQERTAVQSNASVADAVHAAYLGVSGSHVSSYGTGFGDTHAVALQEFVGS
jgi:glycosylphosphatidylinositol transamidase (GPIT) subunit GPI8